MNFGDFLDSNSCGGGGGGSRIVADVTYISNNNNNTAINVPATTTFSNNNNKPMFLSPALSLALQTNMEGQRDQNIARIMDNNINHELMSSNNNNVNGRRSRDELEHDSRSGSDNLDDGASADDLDAAAADNPPRKKRYHRHTPHQIQQLESLFKECPHPDEKQRLELSRRLSLETRQVKFWFQNRRTQMKTQLERHENSILRQENDKLRAENMSIREAMRNPTCTNCGGPALIGEISIEEQHLRIENARLKDELERVCSLAGKFLGRPVPMPNSSLELGVGGINVISDFNISNTNNNNVAPPMEKL